MSEFFLELFSEEMPSGLQKNARTEILKLFSETFSRMNINFKVSKSYSTSKRLVFFFGEISEKIQQKSVELWNSYRYDKNEEDRVVLWVNLEAEQQDKKVFSSTYQLDE